MKAANITFIDQHPGTDSLLDEVHAGLAAAPKKLSPKFFYDQRGSELFDAICDLPEYYPTRTELSILEDCAPQLAARVNDNVMVVELGSGASRKIRILLDALQPAAYMAVDISRDFLIQESRKVAADYPHLDVYAVCTDIQEPGYLQHAPDDMPRLTYFPGSSIGNLEPREALHFMQNLRQAMLADDAFLVGVDLKKDHEILHAAYNDTQGTTAEFNRNLLRRIQRELDTDIEPANFRHQAFYDAGKGRVEMHLVSDCEHRVSIEGKQIEFEAGESIHTECSYKYSIDEFQSLARQAGFIPEAVWTDEAALFSLHYLRPSA